MNRRDPGFDVWVVVADVLVGFLSVLYILYVGVQRSPEDVEKFKKEIEAHRMERGGRFKVESEFSKVRVKYGEKLLFQTCEWTLSTKGRVLMTEHFEILLKYISSISRIQIEGHADSRPAEGCSSLQRVGLRRDNWILSSLRALEVRDFLEEVIHKKRLDVESLKKIEAVGRGDLHPIAPQEPASEVNRRLEITVHFIEKAAEV